ncbi:DUF1802 family protein [Paenibacillus sp. y28]|uniref:DUF1802 family protein n=1 Tax=Paenibacillus sp. y28 TaxID=3129110 RepID=UPI003019D101
MKTPETIALRDWAVIIEAMRKGEQLLIMRKGGIAEETRDFRLASRSFFLYPAYEHQKAEQLKPEHRHGIEATLQSWSPGQETAHLACYAEVTDEFEVTDETVIQRLSRYHICTDFFAEQRLHWKRNKPLHVLILRVYELEQPLDLPVLPSYSGCKSWIRLETEIEPGLSMKPVLDDARFEALRSEILSAIQGI